MNGSMPGKGDFMNSSAGAALKTQFHGTSDRRESQRGKRSTRVQGYWVLWADQDEVRRLGKLMEQSRRGINAYTIDLKRPKQRPTAK